MLKDIKEKLNARLFWLTLSLCFSLFYSLLAVRQIWNAEYAIADDGRQHIFWMQRFLDGSIFPKDLIADYFQSVAPLGYRLFYQFFALLGISPFAIATVLPIGLGIVTTIYFFYFTLQVFPVPVAGFIATIVLNQNLWMSSDLTSATPRAFVYPIFIAFLYYFAKRSLQLSVTTIILQGLFYPQYVLLQAGILIMSLFEFKNFRFGWSKRRSSSFRYGLTFAWDLSRDKKDYVLCAIGLLACAIVLLPYAIQTSQFDPVITAETARTMKEFSHRGRSAFFRDNQWIFWMEASRSGILPGMTPLMWCGIFLPILLSWRSRFPLLRDTILVKQGDVSDRANAMHSYTGISMDGVNFKNKYEYRHSLRILVDILVVSLILFLLSHLFLFQLHLPSRYTGHSFAIVFAVAAAIVLTTVLDRLRRVFRRDRIFIAKVASIVLSLAIASAIVFYPNTLNTFPKPGYIFGRYPELYQFLARQPEDIVVASLADEASNIPTFAGRSTLVAKEYALPYHTGYYDRFRQRASDLIAAQYSTDPEVLKGFVDRYDIDYILLDDDAFDRDYLDDDWIEQYQSATDLAKATLEAGKTPILAKMRDRCTVLTVGDLILIDPRCIQSLENL